MGKEFFKKILFIEDYHETHKRLWFLGLSLKFPKLEYAKRKQQNPYYYYKKNNLDITTLPKATGQLRDIQLANLEILKEFNKVCRENNLEYWLFAGTVLGAVRHKGFIPWDDDIDVAMPREDYSRLEEIFNHCNSKLYVEHFYNENLRSFLKKIRIKNSELLCIDVFSFDYSGLKLSQKEQIDFTKKIKSDRKILKKYNDRNLVLENVFKIRDKYCEKTDILDSDILLGVEWDHSENNWFIPYKSIYPLKEIEFEGDFFFSMFEPVDYLLSHYGNYLSYPKKIGFGHSMFLNLTKEEEFFIKELAKSGVSK